MGAKSSTAAHEMVEERHDVEGFETAVLQGAAKTLKNSTLQAVIMELNGSGRRYGYDESDILNLMLDHGFKCYAYNPMNRTLMELEGKNRQSGNTLFLRNISLIQDRLNTAPKVAIHGHLI